MRVRPWGRWSRLVVHCDVPYWCWAPVVPEQRLQSREDGELDCAPAVIGVKRLNSAHLGVEKLSNVTLVVPAAMATTREDTW